MKDQLNFGGQREDRKRPSPAEDAPTQIPGETPARGPLPKTLAADGEAAPTPFDRSSLRFGPPAAIPPPKDTGDATVVVDLDVGPKVPLAWLAIVDGPGGKRGKVITLKAEILVGRTHGDLLLGGDRGVSSQHLRIRLEPKEGSAAGEQIFVAYDQATTNGTYIGDCASYREERSRVYRRELRDGDYLLLGDTTLVFKQIEEPLDHGAEAGRRAGP